MEVTDLWGKVLPRLREQVNSGSISIEKIAEFCESSPKTVQRWISGGEANGWRLLRLWHLLALTGPAPEINKMPRYNRLLSELFAFGIITIDEVKVYSGSNSNSENYAYFTLKGKPLMSEPFTLSELEVEYGVRLENAKEAAKPDRIEWASPDLPEPPTTPSSEPEEAHEPPLETPASIAPTATATAPLVNPLHTDPKLLLATLLGAATPLAKRLNSDATTAEERSRFRELMGEEVLFELSNTLNALCSERSRGLAR